MLSCSFWRRARPAARNCPAILFWSDVTSRRSFPESVDNLNFLSPPVHAFSFRLAAFCRGVQLLVSSGTLICYLREESFKTFGRNWLHDLAEKEKLVSHFVYSFHLFSLKLLPLCAGHLSPCTSCCIATSFSAPWESMHWINAGLSQTLEVGACLQLKQRLLDLPNKRNLITPAPTLTPQARLITDHRRQLLNFQDVHKLQSFCA